MRKHKNVTLALMQNIPLILFVTVFIIFGMSTHNWFSWANFVNILTRSSYIGILAVGITLPILTGGTDLSVGANMYLSISVSALMIRAGYPLELALLACLAVGIVFGIINAFFVVKLKIPAFLVTIGSMTIGRGLALRITNSEQLAMPQSLVSGIGSGVLFDVIPYPVLIFATVVLLVALYLKYTRTGRQIYAIGFDREVAMKAGIPVNRVWASAYILCGFLAALSAIVSVAQIGSVIPGFGEGYEFNAISASVLGGTSLAGGIANIFPGVVIGTMLIQMVETGLVFLQVDLYLQPLISAMVILFAVFLDSVRTSFVRKLQARNIRIDDGME